MIFIRGGKTTKPTQEGFQVYRGSQESGGCSLTSLQPRGLRGLKFKTDQCPEMGRSQSPGEMSEELNVNRLKNVSTRFRIIKVLPPAATDPSVLDAQIITSRPSGAQRVT